MGLLTAFCRYTCRSDTKRGISFVNCCVVAVTPRLNAVVGCKREKTSATGVSTFKDIKQIVNRGGCCERNRESLADGGIVTNTKGRLPALLCPPVAVFAVPAVSAVSKQRIRFPAEREDKERYTENHCVSALGIVFLVSEYLAMDSVEKDDERYCQYMHNIVGRVATCQPLHQVAEERGNVVATRIEKSQEYAEC